MLDLVRTGLVASLLAAAGLGLTRFAGALATQIRLPRVSGEMAGGLAVGALALSSRGAFARVVLSHAPVWGAAVNHARPLLGDFGIGAVASYLALTSLAIGSSPLRPAWRLAGALAGAYCGLMLICGVLAAALLPPGSLRPAQISTVAFATVASAGLATNGLPVVGRLLSDDGRLETKIGLLALFSGVLITAFTFTGLQLAAQLDQRTTSPAHLLLGAAIWGASVAPLLPGMDRLWHRASRVPGLGRGAVLAVGAGLGSHLVLGSWVVGPSAVGLLLARRAPMPADAARSWVRHAGRWLLPVYFVTAGGALGALRISANALPAVLLASALVVAIAWPGTQLAGWLSRIGPQDRRDLADLSVCRGVLMIIVGLEARRAGLLTEPGMLSMAIAAVISTAMAGLLTRSRRRTGRARSFGLTDPDALRCVRSELAPADTGHG